MTTDFPVVVDASYVTYEDVQLSIAKKDKEIGGGDFTITDSSGKILFRLEGGKVVLRDKKVLKNGEDCPVVTLHKNHISFHGTWEVYSRETDQPLFSIKKKNLMSAEEELYEIFLNGEDEPTYVVKGDFVKRNYSVLLRNEIVAAEVHKKLFSITSFFTRKHKFGVKMFAGVDQAFIAAVVVIMEAVHVEDRSNKGEGSSSDED